MDTDAVEAGQAGRIDVTFAVMQAAWLIEQPETEWLASSMPVETLEPGASLLLRATISSSFPKACKRRRQGENGRSPQGWKQQWVSVIMPAVTSCDTAAIATNHKESGCTEATQASSTTRVVYLADQQGPKQGRSEFQTISPEDKSPKQRTSHCQIN